VRLHGEPGDVDVPGSVVDHVGRPHGLRLDLFSREGEVEAIVHRGTIDRDLHLRPDLALQAVLNLVGREPNGGRVFNPDDAIAGHHAHFLTGPPSDRRDDTRRVVRHLEDDADAPEGALILVLHVFGPVGGDVSGVRIEAADHPLNALLRHVGRVQRVHVLLVHDDEGLPHLVELRAQIVIGQVRVDLHAEHRPEGDEKNGRENVVLAETLHRIGGEIRVKRQRANGVECRKDPSTSSPTSGLWGGPW